MDNTQVLPCIANRKRRAYSSPVAANSAIGFGHPNISRRYSAHDSNAGAFFMPEISLYGGCARGAFERAGCLESRLTNLRTAATHSFGHERGGSSTLGAVPMKHSHSLNPSALQQHAASLKARAIAALHADSSLSVRLARYNAAMAKARALEIVGGVQ